MEIKLIQESEELVKPAIDFFWQCWGNEDNFLFYEDCMLNSLLSKGRLPNFYVALDGNEIVGTYALITNDLISRQDLMPWLACLFVVEEHRNKGLAAKLLEHGLKETARLGFGELYLSTDLKGFYERKGWTPFGKGYGIGGDLFQIFAKNTH